MEGEGAHIGHTSDISQLNGSIFVDRLLIICKETVFLQLNL